MAVKACKECGKEVSSKAKQCPHCGSPQPKSVGIGGIVLVAFVGYVIFIAVGGGGSSTDTTPSSTSSGSPSSPSIPETPPLEVQSWRCDAEYGYIFVRGEVKNVSSRKLENVTAVGEFRTASGELVKTEDALLEYNPIMPGQTSPFKAGGTVNPQIKNCNLGFKYLLGGREIAYSTKEKSTGKGK